MSDCLSPADVCDLDDKELKQVLDTLKPVQKSHWEKAVTHSK